jgi:hypothetical protein
MRKLLILFITVLGFIGCNKKQTDTKFCQNCDLKTDALTVIENQTGVITFVPEFNQYAIQLVTINEPLYFIPCQMPGYFQPVENVFVGFSGNLLQDPYIRNGDHIKSTYNCIKLDTIYSIATY